MAQQAHRSDPGILNRRTLRASNHRLLSALRPGMSVLDIGCGTGAITAGIAAEVAPDGHALGIDCDEDLLAIARRDHVGIANLSFEQMDALAMPFDRCFDLVTAARVLQWISQPASVVELIRKAGKPGGLVVVLDYNHEYNSWAPEPPDEFMRFYSSFLMWREKNQWDNRMADHLPAMFAGAGLTDIQVHSDDEVVTKGDSNFADAAAVWPIVADSLGEQIEAACLSGKGEYTGAAKAFRAWVQDGGLEKQTLQMKTVIGSIP